ncbi:MULTISPECIES: hypothetical protein [Oceanimonas]|uniref:hypothetical protein n=1 Tax=Oceanimonas TaxID=129577 RepID=UPI00114077D4|nr:MULTISPECIES: hypothetical protein [Oceanimonas]NHI01022.1 hypothetical protein [Oceanimonas sp. MB9]
MSIQKKTLAVIVAASLGISFGAAANGYGYGYGYDSKKKDHGDITNNQGLQAVKGGYIDKSDNSDNSIYIDHDVSKYWVWSPDNDVYTTTVKKNYQSNYSTQSGYGGYTNSNAGVYGNSADANAYNGAYMNQHSGNLAAGLGLGLGLGAGVGNVSRNDGGNGGNGGYIWDLGLLTLGILDVNSADGGDGGAGGNSAGIGTGLGAGMGAGAGLAVLTPTQSLTQTAGANAAAAAASVSMITSGNNNLSNMGAVYGMGQQNAISGHGSVGNQSINVNGSAQF